MKDYLHYQTTAIFLFVLFFLYSVCDYSIIIKCSVTVIVY